MMVTSSRSLMHLRLLGAIALSTALAAVNLCAQPPAKKGPKPDVGAGRIAWFDITTTDIARAKAFYGALFDWTFTPVKGAGNLAVEIVSRDLPIGTLRVAEGQITAFNGVVYVQVIDLPASCKQATALGGTVVPGFPFDLPDGRGAIGLINDPSGHPIGMYSPTPLASSK